MKVNSGYWHTLGREKAKAYSASLLMSLLFLLAIWLGACLDRRQLLQHAARLWVVDDTVEPADAVAVFGGGIETRPAAAAGYLREGLAQRILVSQVGPTVADPPSQSHTELNLAELRKLQVAQSAVEVIGCELSDTYQEALALRRWSLSTGAHSLIVPTEYFSSRRVRWILQRVFQGTGVQVRVPVISSLYYLQGEWWNHADAPWAFGREVIKYVGYRLVYGLLGPSYESGNVSRTCSN
jgi:hypothetical protein